MLGLTPESCLCGRVGENMVFFFSTECNVCVCARVCMICVALVLFYYFDFSMACVVLTLSYLFGVFHYALQLKWHIIGCCYYCLLRTCCTWSHLILSLRNVRLKNETIPNLQHIEYRIYQHQIQLNRNETLNILPNGKPKRDARGVNTKKYRNILSATRQYFVLFVDKHAVDLC